MSTPAPRILSLFATPVYTMKVPDADISNGELAEAILARRARNEGARLSNVGGWQSANDMLAWGGPAAQALAGHATALCGQVSALASGHSPAADTWLPEMWANVSERGASNQSHWHPGSFLSLVYYVDDGYRHSDPSAGGELVFIDPRMPFVRMRTPDLRHMGPDGDGDEHETWMRPTAGLLVAFPSFLAHSVRPYYGDGTRISIAINIVVRGHGAAR